MVHPISLPLIPPTYPRAWVNVAVPVPLGHPLTYWIPDAIAPNLSPGTRVLCRIRQRSVVAVALKISTDTPPIDPNKLIAIDAVIDDTPCLPAELLAFLQEMASYYFAPIGAVLQLALPALERAKARDLDRLGIVRGNLGKRVGGRQIQVVRPTPASESTIRLSTKSLAVLAHIRSAGEVPITQLQQVSPSARTIVRKLAEHGLVEVHTRETSLDPFFAVPVAQDRPQPPTDAQRAAIEAIQLAIHLGAPRGFLLHGVTGSGKTEVYLQVMEACLNKGKGVLLLVPEIALTPQLVSRFRARFGDKLAVLHSALSDRERYEMWKNLRNDVVQVAIGARSALLAPLPRIGLIIVDEEHDGSYKQDEGIRYHARDMALLRAHRAQAVCVLGSATPSLESEWLARQGKLDKLSLPARAVASALLPRVESIDLRRTGPGPAGHPLLSLPLHRAIEQTLAQREQAIIFLNRRGFAPSVLCEGCGELLRCPFCSVTVTFHRSPASRLRCHYCEYDVPMPSQCPSCKTPKLTLLGLGTERLEETLSTAFPTARIARLDRDVAPGAQSEVIINRMREGEVDILVGTQMVTKGHDLPNVTLVGVINADAALSLPDFRASERTFQLLVQVAGRAGRAERAGRVLVQTRLPEHPVLRFAMDHDVSGFIEHELAARREAHYPPFVHLALCRSDGPVEANVKAETTRLTSAVRAHVEVQNGHVEVLGPSPAPIEKVRDRFRFRILLRSADRKQLRSVIHLLRQSIELADRSVHHVVDVDPLNML